MNHQGQFSNRKKLSICLCRADRIDTPGPATKYAQCSICSIYDGIVLLNIIEPVYQLNTKYVAKSFPLHSLFNQVYKIPRSRYQMVIEIWPMFYIKYVRTYDGIVLFYTINTVFQLNTTCVTKSVPLQSLFNRMNLPEINPSSVRGPGKNEQILVPNPW